jgi:hypothetical protein
MSCVTYVADSLWPAAQLHAVHRRNCLPAVDILLQLCVWHGQHVLACLLCLYVTRPAAGGGNEDVSICSTERHLLHSLQFICTN